MPSIQHTPEPAVFRSEKGAINGVASLDSSGLVPNSQLPSATQSAAGTMSAADKTKLDGIATGATANVVSDSLSDTSTTNALSAAKGKALNDSVTALNSQIANMPYKTEKTISPGGTVSFTLPSYYDIGILISAVSNNNSIVYVYSYGYLSPIQTDSKYTVSLSSDYKTINVTLASSGTSNTYVGFISFRSVAT